MSLNVACQMDPIHAIDIEGDSTFAMLLEASHRGHSLFFYTPENLALDGQRLMARGTISRSKMSSEIMSRLVRNAMSI